jgi:hypothetical protein
MVDTDMNSIRPCAIPPSALLSKYQGEGSFADCYVTEVSVAVDQAAFVEAFYTTALFRVERALLKHLAGLPSTDEEVAQLAAGSRNSFAAWQVESREESQLLVRAGRTRSWFMTTPGSGAGIGTRLYFGSAVVGKADARGGKPRLGFLFRLLLGFHRIYSRALLLSARSRVLAAPATTPS